MDDKTYFYKPLWNKFQTKVTAALIFSMLFIGLLSNAIIDKYILDKDFEQLRERLKIIASVAVVAVDPAAFKLVPPSKEGIDTPYYRLISSRLEKIRKENPLLRFIYTMKPTNEEGVWEFVVDPNPDEKKTKGLTAYPGDRYNASRFPEMLKALEAASADKKMEKDEWGVTLSGYAPIIDSDGKTIGILGVDMLASDIYSLQMRVYVRMVLILILGVILSVLLGMLLSKPITIPIERLVEGTRRIGQGDLRYKVEVGGNDEISGLAESFNKMAKDLERAHKEHHDYFYSVIQSMVRIVEAKDYGTRGHSERVAEYAVKIAQRMNFSKEQIEILEQTAILHDIGKLAVHDNILNKRGHLTPEEWETIKNHPVIGEDILRPVSINSEMLAAVRGHHERYDGQGYPDHLNGEEIHVFAQILSVADAYDAMTSARAYRAPMSKEKAMEELKNNRGSQFNPFIVNIFLGILEEESNPIR